MSQPKYRLAILDDHPIVLEGLVNVLAGQGVFEIAGAFTTVGQFLEFFNKTSIQVVLLDIILPDGNGMDVCKVIKSKSPDTVVLALSNHDQRSAVMKMLENGASGYLLKNASIAELVTAINDALAGQIVFSNAIREIMTRPAPDAMDAPVLTARELEILKLIATGITTRRIAEMLFLSKFTVENHRKNLLQKFRVNNVAGLISAASSQGLLG
ncbi:two component transcriptional regulator, LuxR family [Chitinophaga terrae (ex Kim and Jung 2007)]|uniref:Two component transcriptional regulator, LuxR family n=1 Tax=Chitinophaga terrae (ex Kim and Jung 2007) TaxID=408074 RepID=A0A1H4BTD8_9BACT|nr:response regulator transcription factor [Chitinophaga terrae (ex Kim and Jung 2007)]MDQ0108668.1 DNA-binding NarL/FixJ family response regulator [Chitinophaga terrae (ex Kim and Jung 2007)]GEP89766.1 DNA-binding response regulator [Chitinophaga terrae (ex Kim and Jung 2007)]SEA51364.1 two component transcriptional regulator, LuxR family [Chitinophaga terrae (ex Kim and Jung 2007)]